MAKQTDNLFYLDYTSGRPHLIGPNSSIAISKDLEIGGNLTVLGTMSYIDSEILTSDNYLFMNSEYSSTTSRKGGLIINSKIDSAKRGTLFSATASTSKIVIVGTTSFNAGDIIAVVGSTDKLNDGVYEVQSSAAADSFKTEITIKSTVATGFEEMFKVSFVDEGQVNSCIVGLCTLSVLRSDPVASAFEAGFGTNTGSISFQDIAGSGSNLQTAYDVGNEISMTAASGQFKVSPASSQTVGFSLEGSAASNIKTSSGNALTIETDSGAMNLTSGTGDIVASTANTNKIKLLTGANESGSSVYGRLLLDANAVSLVANGASSSLSLNSSHGAVSVTSNSSTVDITSNGVMTLTSIGNQSDIDIVSGREFTVATGQSGSSAGKISMVATNGDMELSTATDGDISISSVKGISATATEGALALSTSDGALTLSSSTGSNNTGTMSLTSQETLDISAAKKMTLASNASAQTILISSVGAHSSRSHASTDSKVWIDTDSLDVDTEVFNIASTGSSSDNEIVSTGANSTLKLQTVGELQANSTSGDVSISADNSVHIKATDGTNDNLILLKNGSNSVLLLAREDRINSGRTLVIGDDVTASSAIMGGTAVPKQTGAGLRVTADYAVSVGEILSIDTNGRFAKAKAGRATEGASQLPQNPIGVALGNGQSSTYTDINMSTVTGAVVLVQFDGTPSASDLGMPVFLSDSNGKAGTSMPAANSPADGLIRVTQVGTLLSTTATTASDYTGSNISLYPILWNVDYIVDK